MKQTSEEAFDEYTLDPGSDRIVPPAATTSADRTLSMEPVVDAGRARLAVGTTSYLSCGAAADGGVLSDGDLTTPSPRRSTPLPLPLIAEPGLLFILHGRPYLSLIHI